jgi:ComEC/Rec2-related protein
VAPPWIAAGGGPPLVWPDGAAKLARVIGERIRLWLTAEVAPGRLVPWLAIAFGCGIVVYFSVSQEPVPWAAAAFTAGAVVAAILLRHRPFAFPAALFAALMAGGFATATIKRAMIAHPVLAAPAWNVEITGFVESREERERSDRITVRVASIFGPRLEEQLERVRVSVRKGTAPAVGSFVDFKARLSPPLEPLRPGGYDFARDMYFQRIGASGFVLGRIRTTEPPHAPTLWLRYATVIDGMREAIDKRIRAVLPGDKGSIASALITGKRDALSAPVFDAMYVSGIGHVLSISGYHMAVVVAIVFFAIRASLALMPGANRYPIKKWAAVVALAVATFYLLLSGAEVATQRSYIMIAIVLIGVMIDRATVTFRTLTVAALGVMLLAPESVVHPSFQMSFAATLALVAGYQGGVHLMTAGADTPFGARVAPIRTRRPVLAADGGGARLDDPDRALGGEPARRRRSRGGLRQHPVARLHGGSRAGVSAQDAAAPHRCGPDRSCHRADDSFAAARRAGRAGRLGLCGARRRRAARGGQIRQRRLCGARMACRRRRCPRAQGQHAGQRHPLRPGRLYRAAARWLARGHRQDHRGVRGGLPPHCISRERARGAAGLPHPGDRSAGLAPLGRHRPAARRRRLRGHRRAAQRS